MVFLSIGAIFSGYLFKSTFIGHQNNEFWQSSIFFLNEIIKCYALNEFIKSNKPKFVKVHLVESNEST